MLLAKAHQSSTVGEDVTDLVIVTAEEELVAQQMEWDATMVQAQISRARQSATDTYDKVFGAAAVGAKTGAPGEPTTALGRLLSKSKKRSSSVSPMAGGGGGGAGVAAAKLLANNVSGGVDKRADPELYDALRHVDIETEAARVAREFASQAHRLARTIAAEKEVRLVAAETKAVRYESIAMAMHREVVRGVYACGCVRVGVCIVCGVVAVCACV